MKKCIIILMLSLVSAWAYPYDTDIRKIASKSPEDGLFEALLYYEIKHPYIVYSQAVLETGWFSSKLCREGNNLFGIWDSRNHCYKTYTSWVFSVIDYLNLVQYKYKGGDYYEFLERIGYAADENYTTKVRMLAEEFMQYD